MNAELSGPKSFVVAVDGSEHALAATHLLGDLPLPAGSEVTVLAVLTPRHTPGRAALLAALDEAQRLLKHNGLKINTRLLDGQPAEALAQYAQAHQPDLLVVGAKGQRATASILVGGVAQQLVEHVQHPVLMVRAPYAGLRRILLVVDGSPHSQCAVDYLAHFPLSSQIELTVMNVLPPLPGPTSLMYVGAYGVVQLPVLDDNSKKLAAEQAEAEEQEGKQLLARTVEALPKTQIEAARILARGDAATEILEHVQKHAIDLIVAGSRGLGAVKGWLLGSVSRKLIHYAGCSVLIVRAAPQPAE
jgi:nucleotide-binding universal stress UspA family protein